MSTNLTAAAALALWLQENEPAVFALLQQAAAKAKGKPAAPALGDWSSLISSIGSDLSSAVSDVGSYLQSSNGQSTLSSVIQQYLGSNNTASQGQVLQTQAQRASAGQAPAAIGYAVTSSGQAVPVYTSSTLPPALAGSIAAGESIPATTVTGQTGYTLTPAMTAGLAPSGFSALLKSPIAWAAAAGLAYLILKR